MKKILGLTFLCLALAVSVLASSDQKTYTQQVMGASATATFTVDQPYARDWPQIEYIIFFVKTASVSGTTTFTVEMLDGADTYNLPFNLTSSSSTSLGNSTGTIVSTTAPGAAAGNYIVSVCLADFGGQVLGPVRLKAVTSAASGATVNVKSSVFSNQ